MSETKDGLDFEADDVTVEGVVDHADGTVEVPEAAPQEQPKAAHPGTSKIWLPGIEALRGVAALTVVAHHSWALSNQPRWSWSLEWLSWLPFVTPDSRFPSTWWSRGSGCGA